MPASNHCDPGIWTDLYAPPSKRITAGGCAEHQMLEAHLVPGTLSHSSYKTGQNTKVPGVHMGRHKVQCVDYP